MRAIETDLGDDLAEFSLLLWRGGLAHRIFEERGRQVLEVASVEDVERVRSLYGDWRDGRVTLARRAGAAAKPGPSRHRAGLASLAAGIARYPVVAFLIGLSLLVFPFSAGISAVGVEAVTLALLIVDPTDPGKPGWLPMGGELWRLVTPIFLHFSVLHVAFNSVIVLELGRRLETGLGSGQLVAVVTGIAVVSNIAQWLAAGQAFFGGLSGVGYGMLGLLVALKRRHPDDPRWSLPPGLALGLVLFLVLFSTGITEPFGLHVANAAHWGGLLTGLLLSLLCRPRRQGT